MKLKRTEYDEIGEVLIRKAREIDPMLKTSHLVRIFGRTYYNLLKRKKLEENDVSNEKAGSIVTMALAKTIKPR